MQVEAALARTWRGMQVERERERKNERGEKGEEERKREIARTQTGFERKSGTGIWNGCNFCDFTSRCRSHATKLSSCFRILSRQIIFFLSKNRILIREPVLLTARDRAEAPIDRSRSKTGERAHWPFELSEARRFDFAMWSGVGYRAVHTVRDA